MFRKKKSEKNELPVHTVLRLSKKLGAERISKDAARLLADFLTEELEKMVQDAANFAKHAERKTIMVNDIKLVIKKRI
jgi:histone H3/H4